MNSLQILIIEDRSWIREIVRGHVVRKWPQAMVRELESRELTEQHRVEDAARNDVVLLAQNLDFADSDSMLKRLRSEAPGVPVVVVTKAADEVSIVSAFRSGAADVLSHGRLDERSVQSVIREAMRSGKPAPAPTHEAQPESGPAVKVPGYEIETRIARSALSSVYRAYSHALKRRVAFKVLHGLGNSGDESVRRFVLEHEVLSGIRHDNVVRIFDIGATRDDLFIAMEYLPGGTLRAALGNGPLSEARSIALIEQTCSALRAIHHAGVLHRDLKPANIMLRADGAACLIDFGLAKQYAVAAEITVPGRLYGTPYYMSPEQGQGLATDVRSDLYSLGIVFYELLTGVKPYVAGTPVALVFKHAHAPLPVLPERLARWQALLDMLLAKEPADRPASALAVVDLVNHCKNS